MDGEAQALELVERARAGHPGAIADLLRAQRTHVIRYATRLCISPEDAEDAAQETLLALSRNIAALREVAALSRWLFRAVRTHCTRLARRSLRQTMLGSAADLGELAPSAEDVMVDEQLRQRLAAVMSELEPTARDLLVRRDILGETAPDIARDLGIGVEALKSRLHRARGEARKRLLASISRTGSAPGRSFGSGGLP